MFYRLNVRGTPAVFAAMTLLLGACTADPSTSKAALPADKDNTESVPTETSEAVPGEPTYSPDPGEVITLPQRQGWSVLRQGRYTVRVTPSLDYQVDVPDNYRALSGRFLNTPVEGPSIFFVAPAPADRTRLPVRPCRDHTTTKPVGPTVSDLAEALRDQPLLQVSKPVPVTLDSHKGLYLEVRIPLRVDPRPCTDNKIALWSQGPDGWLWEPGYLGRWWILDVHGQRTVVMPQCDTTCPDTQLNTLTQMAESITFTTKQ